MVKRKQIPFSEWGWYGDTTWDREVSRFGLEVRKAYPLGYGTLIGELNKAMSLMDKGEEIRGILKGRLKRETL